jgi:Protein of unknown function (DUF1416)
MCGAPPQAPELPPGIDLSKETVIYGVVSRAGAPVPSAYVRLLDAGGEFTAEVVSSATGDYRFYAAPGQWTISVLVPGATPTRKPVRALQPGLVEVPLVLA